MQQQAACEQALTRALRFLKEPRRASKKQKNTAELMPLLSARGPTPLQPSRSQLKPGILNRATMCFDRQAKVAKETQTLDGGMLGGRT